MAPLVFRASIILRALIKHEIYIISGAAVRRPHGSHQDTGSNPAAARNEKWTFGAPPTEGSPMVQQDLSGRPAMSKLNQTCTKNEKKKKIITTPHEPCDKAMPHMSHGNENKAKISSFNTIPANTQRKYNVVQRC